ncbi:SDR family NAD(P)-dependent oxidoreductase [Pseudoruegeria sp. SHC-113]|uniref:SDR family NAD(P)-dependent oxidoreductase n=1 Tax=Pseudoruegeria sp. SHC-113 TaxID=2855439 RepID=UPI0021BB1C7D|nr:SDR family NAD(P)-dependent oxidoreductase [Pseudoruegeria sp. SHC-113]MCT8161878.1 SDR family NAD(P)-dependent oxidoreductase [Pseudoruegeria sp. SHC-113]
MPKPDLFTGKRYWIVGASEGLGRALAEALVAEGASLVLSARNAERLTALAAELGDAAALPMDVTDAASVEAACAAAGEVDAIIYCAGAYDPMNGRAFDLQKAEQIMEVNYNGALRTVHGILPAMLARKSGRIVLVGSLAGFRGLPGAVGYSGSKAALMSFGETLYADLRGTGVSVQLVHPGFIRTRLTDKNSFNMPGLMSPEEAAGHVMGALKSGRFQTSFPFAFSLVFRLGRFLPASWFYRLMPLR